MPIVNIRNLDFAFSAEAHLYRGVDIELKEPGFYSFFGRSGVGKTTLARILAGHIRDFTSTAYQVPRLTLYSSKTERLPRWQRIGDHLAEVNTGEAEAVSFHLSAMGLDSTFLLRKPHQLSSGQLARVNVLRYLLQQFEMLLFDEPLSSVDEPTRLETLAHVKSTTARATTIYISHDLLEVSTFSKRIFVLKRDSDSVAIATVEGLDLPRYSKEREHDITAVAGCVLAMA